MAKKLKWEKPTIKLIGTTKRNDTPCGSGSGVVGICSTGNVPGGGLDNCTAGTLANGCVEGTLASPI